MVVEAFKAYQAEEVSALIRRDLLEIIAKEYPADYLDSLLEHFTPANIRATAKKQQIFVAIDDGKIIGTASLANFGSQNEPRYYGTAVFVLPESQGEGSRKTIDASSRN